MKVTVIAHPHSKNPHITKDPTGILHMYVKERAFEGKANKAILKALANHLKIRKNHIFLISGVRSKHKVFEIITPGV